MFSGVVSSLRAIVARPASLLLAALAIFSSALVALASAKVLLGTLWSALHGAALPSASQILAVATLATLSWAAIWPLLAAALRHVEEGDLWSLWPAPRHAPALLLLGALAALAKLATLLLLVAAFTLLFRSTSPTSGASLFALALAPAFLLLMLADCITLGALPLVSERGIGALGPALLAVLNAPHRAIGILSLSSLVLAPLLLLASPLAFGALRWPPTAASLLLLLSFSLCLAPLPLLLSKSLSEGLLLRRGSQW